ncbi:hypothetical protein PF005_g4915 [Phytophthora fragariae]|uniref:Uncharacterized protein n=2 Tax=Phytophthora TaxID=4783 RepID=A0A6A3YYB7_9STRA|nr:hypothetical protein PF003_g39630 [Phytophthora fragariae]KAE9046754.1 hypothetical protein PR002_g1459 [Phytophthora rubi]KAE8947963.1 hypothetical protein PF009_g2440 [Phytophthora fragariae]KAE9028442.1 hypothetical protein PF011_g1551 [Phytophthora fragariae]KAE9049303.1 hypothetical protein PR001_g3443 [Phytophthora rubi]
MGVAIAVMPTFIASTKLLAGVAALSQFSGVEYNNSSPAESESSSASANVVHSIHVRPQNALFKMLHNTLSSARPPFPD